MPRAVEVVARIVCRTVELPDTCPKCGADTREGSPALNRTELIYGRFDGDGDTCGEVDYDGHPAWYRCACGQMLTPEGPEITRG
jgi:rRNA maturation protein Nop10